MPVTYNHEHENEITIFAETNFRNQKRRFGIKTDDRRRHIYIIGKTGMGKTTLMENMILADIYAGHGCCYIDPHGDTAERLVDFIPSNRINDVIYYNPADLEYPMGFNILETSNDEQKHLVRDGLMGVFKKIWPDVWSARMEYILQNCVSALLDYPGATLLGINRLLVDKEYRARVIAKIRDPIVKTFWVAEFPSWSEKYATEAIAPVQNKVGQFLSSSVIRNIVAQVKSTVDLRRIMDDGKVLIVNLSKGRIGEDNMRLLGGMLITKLQLAAQERQNIQELDRRDFYLYVDEFQNFANQSFANILSEARKYRLNLIVAHQYIAQIDEDVAPAIFGNVGTIIVMRVGGADAEFMETEFTPTFLPEDLVSLAKFQMYLKLMVDGVATQPFSANTLPPIAKRTGTAEKVIAVSRERYAEPRAVIEEKVLQWSGMELAVPLTADRGERAASVPSSIQYPAIKTEDELEQERANASDAEGGEYLKINPERMAAITAAIPAGKKEKPKFNHTCSRCAKIFQLAIQLDASRPIYCQECRAIVLEERAQRSSGIREVKKTPPMAGATPSVPRDVLPRTQIRPPVASQPNRPRVLRSEPIPVASGRINVVAAARPISILDEIIQERGVLPETDKHTLEARADRPAGEGRERNRHRRRRGSPSASGPTTPARSPNIPTDAPERLDVGAPPVPLQTTTPYSVAPGERVRFDI